MLLIRLAWLLAACLLLPQGPCWSLLVRTKNVPIMERWALNWCDSFWPNSLAHSAFNLLLQKTFPVQQSVGKVLLLLCKVKGFKAKSLICDIDILDYQINAFQSLCSDLLSIISRFMQFIEFPKCLVIHNVPYSAIYVLSMSMAGGNVCCCYCDEVRKLV